MIVLKFAGWVANSAAFDQIHHNLFIALLLGSVA